MTTSKPKLINPSHYLLGCRFDNWAKLLWHNRGTLDPKKLPMTACITAVSAVTFPVAGLEKLLWDNKIHNTVLTQDPLFVIGHWRSGTTYVQNILSRDPQFGWCDPVSTSTMSISNLMRKPVTKVEARVLKSARPMDNLQYDIDLPLEDTFGIATISPYSIIHMIAFPSHYRDYLPGCFISDLPPEDLEDWRRKYRYFLCKLTLHCGGKRLMLKSPDNTGHLRELLKLYPHAQFLNIHRDPYTTIMSTIYMFKKQMARLRLTRLPDVDEDLMLEETIVYIYERMYRDLFALEQELPPNTLYSVDYEAFCRAPMEKLEELYRELALPGFETAKPLFRQYIDAQRGYVKNSFTLTPRLKERINSRLGFYFDRYGYEREN